MGKTWAEKLPCLAKLVKLQFKQEISHFSEENKEMKKSVMHTGKTLLLIKKSALKN